MRMLGRGTWIWGWLLPAWLSAQTGTNRLQNGGFEGTTAPWVGGFGAKAEAVRVSGPDAASGSGCLRFSCSGQVAAVDHPKLRLGHDLSRRGTYRLSAMIRNDGVKAGNFGLRLYFHDASGQFLAMVSGLSVGPGAAPHGWTRYETGFGRGTAAPLPPGAATLLVRFSFWADDGKPVGSVWLDDVVLEQTAEAPPPAPGTPPTALLWDDPALSTGSGPVAGGLEGALVAAGFAVRRVDTTQLAQAGGLDRTTAAAIVLPYGPSYPAALGTALPAFMAEGGLLVTLGAGAFTQPLYASPHGWLPAEVASPEAAPVPLGFHEGWDLVEAAPEARLRLDGAKDGQTGTFSLGAPGQYAYLGTRLPQVPADDVILAFEARGDAATPRFCLELRERDGSRWKAIVPLNQEWTSHRVHAGLFVSYANEKLGRTEGPIRPRELDRLFVGMTAAMVGPGPHRLDLRAVRLEPAAVGTAAVAATPVFAGAEREVARWFGQSASLPARRPPLTCFAPTAQPWTARRLVVPDGVPLPTRTALRGRFTGLGIGAPEAVATTPLSPRRDLPAVLRGASSVERLPLLRTERLLSAAEEDAVVLFCHRDGLLAGSRWLCVGLDAAAVAQEAALATRLADALRLAQTAILSDGVYPRFRVADGKPVLDVVLRARNPAGTALELPLGVRVALAGQEALAQRTVMSLTDDSAIVGECILATGIPIADQEWLAMDLLATIEADGPALLGPRRFRLDARAALRQIADHLVAQAADDGRLHGYSFIDNRGMRTLLAAAEILGRKAYREPPRRWAELMLREQREDGGYRMGYGMTSKGEECYVADGGEIAVGIARLVSYSTGRDRQRLRRSLDAYMAYRDSFRVPGGGIGVGWCLHDYGRRPVIPLETPTRIYAPEINTYTIGCSLAAAYAHAAIYASTPLENRAQADADWLMSRTTALHGAFVESFQYAHAFTRDATQRAIYADYIGRAFSAKLKESGAAGHSWWLAGGGRSALDLGGLAYALARLGDDPVLRAEMMRATCLMFSPDSPESVLQAIELAKPGHDGWIYICYGTLGLVDVIQPVVSMDGFVPRR